MTTFADLQALARTQKRPAPSDYVFKCDKRPYGTEVDANGVLMWYRGRKKFRKGRVYFCDEHKAWHITK